MLTVTYRTQGFESAEVDNYELRGSDRSTDGYDPLYSDTEELDRCWDVAKRYMQGHLRRLQALSPLFSVDHTVTLHVSGKLIQELDYDLSNFNLGRPFHSPCGFVSQIMELAETMNIYEFFSLCSHLVRGFTDKPLRNVIPVNAKKIQLELLKHNTIRWIREGNVKIDIRVLYVTTSKPKLILIHPLFNLARYLEISLPWSREIRREAMAAGLVLCSTDVIFHHDKTRIKIKASIDQLKTVRLTQTLPYSADKPFILDLSHSVDSVNLVFYTGKNEYLIRSKTIRGADLISTSIVIVDKYHRSHFNLRLPAHEQDIIDLAKSGKLANYPEAAKVLFKAAYGKEDLRIGR